MSVNKSLLISSLEVNINGENKYIFNVDVDSKVKWIMI